MLLSLEEGTHGFVSNQKNTKIHRQAKFNFEFEEEAAV
jgi:hypothetical protein